MTPVDGAAVGDRLVRYENVAEVIAHGATRTAVVLRSGLQVDIRAVPKQSYGAALLYFTGSKAHNIALRALANGHGWKLNEYGLFSGKRRIAGATEEEIYKKLGLVFIPPELGLTGSRPVLMVARRGISIQQRQIRWSRRFWGNWSGVSGASMHVNVSESSATTKRNCSAKGLIFSTSRTGIRSTRSFATLCGSPVFTAAGGRMRLRSRCGIIS